MVDMPVGNVFTEVVESTVRQISKAGPNFDTNLSFDASSASEALHVLLGASLFCELILDFHPLQAYQRYRYLPPRSPQEWLC